MMLRPPLLPIPKTALFTEKPYSAPFLNSTFQELHGRPSPFLGILKADAGQGFFILFILHGEPYAAGKWWSGPPQPISLHEYFQALEGLSAVRLSLYESDPVYLKCLMALFQKVPSTQATTDLVNIEGLLERLQHEPAENLLVLKRDEEYSLFYFFKQKLMEAYFVDPELQSREASLEEALLSYVYNHQASSPLELMLFSDLKVSAAQDARPSASDDTAPVMVDFYLRPCPRLLLLEPRGAGRELQLHKKVFSIGRQEENDLPLDDPLVSRKHATIRCEGEEFWLRDEKSRNGVLLNGNPVTATRLSDGDEIQIGEYRIKFLAGTEKERKVAPLPIAAGEGETVVLTQVMAAQRPDCWLEVTEGPHQGARFEVSQDRVIIGRGQADVVILDPKISRQHAVLEWTEEGYRLTDHGSVNGCLVNGKPVKSCLVAPGDTIRLGGTTLKMAMKQ